MEKERWSSKSVGVLGVWCQVSGVSQEKDRC